MLGHFQKCKRQLRFEKSDPRYIALCNNTMQENEFNLAFEGGKNVSE